MPEVGEIIRSEKTGRLGRFLGDGKVELLYPGQEVTSPKTGRRGRINNDNQIELVEEKEKKSLASGFGERLSESAKNRGNMAFEILSAQAQGEQSWGETAMQLVGKVGAGMYMDTAFNAIVTAATGAGRAIGAITPDIIEDPIKDVATYSAHFMLNNPVVQEGIETAMKGANDYSIWKQNNPRAARNLEAVTNIAILAAPVKRGGAVADGTDDVGRNALTRPRKAPSSILSRTAQKIDDSAAAQSEKLKESHLLKAITPDDIKSSNKELIQSKKLTEGGLFKSSKFKPDDVDSDAIASLMKSGKVKPGQTMKGLYNAIDDTISKLDQDMRKHFTNSASQQINKSEVLGQLDDLMKRTIEKNSELAIADNRKAVESLFARAKHFVTQNKGSAKGVLQARRAFDKEVRDTLSKAQKGFESTTQSALGNANLSIRQELNSIASKKVPKIAETLKKQSNLFKVQETVFEKAASESRNAFMNIWRETMKKVGIRSEFNNVLAAATGIGGLGAAAAYAPLFTSFVATPYVAYKAGKLVLSPAAKKSYATLMRGIDDAIKSTRIAGGVDAVEIVKSLRADRALVAQFLNEGLFD